MKPPQTNESAVKVIRQSGELLAGLEEGSPARETVARQVVYLSQQEPRLDYRSGPRGQEPWGSGAV